MTRERLIDEVWDTNWYGSTKTLDVHVVEPAPEARRRLGGRRASSTPSAASGFRLAGADELRDEP